MAVDHHHLFEQESHQRMRILKLALDNTEFCTVESVIPRRLYTIKLVRSEFCDEIVKSRALGRVE